MKTFETNDGKYIVRIGGGTAPFTDPRNGQENSIQLDLLVNYRNGGFPSDDLSTVCSNVQLPELIAAVNEIPGVEATYTPPPKPRETSADLPVGTVAEWKRHQFSFSAPDERIVKVGPNRWLIGTGTMPATDYYIDRELAEHPENTRRIIVYGGYND